MAASRIDSKPLWCGCSLPLPRSTKALTEPYRGLRERALLVSVTSARRVKT